MINWLKKYFIPHHGNNHKPHFLRYETIQSIVIAIIIIEILFILAPFFSFLRFNGSKFMASVLPGVVASLTNQNREAQNLPDLKDNPLLDQAATLKAQDMVANGYFAHISPSGKEPWDWFNQVGYSYQYAGENLAVDFTDSQDVTDAWMKSPTHRANIVKAAYTEIGTGVATGMFEGRETTFVVQMYGTPKAAGAPVTKPAAPVETSSPVKTDPRLAEATPSKAPSAKPTALAVADAPASADKPEVLGAETSGSFADSEAPQTETAKPETLSTPSPATQSTNKIVNFVKQTISSPRHTYNTLLVVLAILVIVALFLKVLVRIDVQHPVLITNGLVLIALIAGLYTANIYIGKVKEPVIGSGSSVATLQNS